MQLGETIEWLGAIFVLYVSGVIVARIVRRRRTRLNQPTPAPPPTFDLAELQIIYASGKITSEEYERLRVVVMNQRRDLPLDPKQGSGFEVLPKG